MMPTANKTLKPVCSCNWAEKSTAYQTLDHAGFVKYFDDFYLQYFYNTDRLVDSIVREFSKRNATEILDCAAGTGFPALQLRQRGYNLDCSDMDQEMIRAFQGNAIEMAVSAKIECLEWSELDKLGKQYDFILCRGNSLVYDGSWDGGQEIALANKIEKDITAMADRLRPGGYLYIDVARSLRLGKAQYTLKSGNAQYSITEEVIPCNGGRHWFMKVEFKDQNFICERWSSNYSLKELQDTLQKIGFSNLDEVALSGERQNFAVIIARKSV